MISQIAAIRSSFPSAFSALGVGCICALGQLPLGLALRGSFPSGARLAALELPGSILPAIPFLAAFAAFFYVYAMGLAIIAVSGRLRGQDPLKEAERVARIFRCGNEGAIKFWFEQRAVAETFDGLGASIGISGLSIACAVFLTGASPLWLALTLVLVCFLSMWAFWREAEKRLLMIDSLVLSLVRDHRSP